MRTVTLQLTDDEIDNLRNAVNDEDIWEHNLASGALPVGYTQVRESLQEKVFAQIGWPPGHWKVKAKEAAAELELVDVDDLDEISTA